MKEKIEKYSYRFKCMTTPCEVQLYAKHAADTKRVFSLIEANTRRLEKKYNYFGSDSFLTELNTRSNNIVKIDDETRTVLSLVRTLSEKTQGCFDITVGTLKQCTHLSSVEEIERCRARLRPLIGPDKWSVSGNSLQFSNSSVKLDLGGVIKEYAVDQAGGIAKKENMPALINFGGDIYVNGSKPDGSGFSVAIKNPKDPKQSIAVLKLSDQGLTTSAHYERGTLVEGKNYSHIITHTVESEPVPSILSATVVSNSVLESGIYSTSLMIKPTLDIDETVNVILIDDQLRVHHNIGA
ncbi:MAG: FAD:protein FMN transferase [Gammaproteobacteria bacterium]|nr:FAD:protein FMN transferase [Gammaproteobacteria bacterium]